MPYKKPEDQLKCYQNYYARLKAKALEKLGGRCANPCCSWVNVDGSIGCTDFRCLQVDHVKSGGNKDRRENKLTGPNIYYAVLRDTTGKFQALCANCNWIKRCLNHEGWYR